jgi:hypothetical protein
MRIIRIASLSGVGVVLIVLFTIGYQVIMLNNTGILERVSGIVEPPVFAIFLLSLVIFFFVSSLIAFPYYIIQCIPFFLLDNWLTTSGREQLKNKSHMLVGLVVNALIIGVLVLCASVMSNLK